MATCVVGLQWGDEAKGKIVDLLTDQHDFVVRFNGGANAGHTVVVDGQAFKFSLLPTGVLRPGVQAVIANGVVVDPEQFFQEIETLRAGGISIGSNLLVSDHAHVIFPHHREEERLAEQGGGQVIGTTGRGIGPCYMDKVARHWSLRVGELLDPQHLRQRLGPIVERKNLLLRGLTTDTATVIQFEVERLAQRYAELGQAMRPHVTDTVRLLHDALCAGKRLLFEAAQGSLLDVDHGTYPYVTSSNSSAAGVWSGSGVPATCLKRIVGVIKAYSTRVGRGPFPTELDDELGERIRKRGREYGTVTGRPRRCGWFDAVAARYSAIFNGVTELAVMLLDVLAGLDELRICTAYELDGERIDFFPGDAFKLERCKPIYETLPGWRNDVSGARKLADLPAAARRYLDRLAELLERPIAFVSVGPDRAQTILTR